VDRNEPQTQSQTWEDPTGERRGTVPEDAKVAGYKRHEIGRDHIARIVQTFGDFAESDIAKIFDNDDFGYRRVVVERPLRLNFRISEERIERLHGEPAFVALANSKRKGAAAAQESEDGRKLQDRVLNALRSLGPSELFTSREAFERTVRAGFDQARIVLPAPVLRAVIGALSERDGDAEICVDHRGRAEPDPELRDTENVPLKEDIHAYFERELKPHIPDAWLDETKTRVGYEVPFTRYFYRYQSARPLREIERELESIRAQIRSLSVGIF
jgi:type I restriction enzyme M protein